MAIWPKTAKEREKRNGKLQAKWQGPCILHRIGQINGKIELGDKKRRKSTISTSKGNGTREVNLGWLCWHKRKGIQNHWMKLEN